MKIRQKILKKTNMEKYLFLYKITKIEELLFKVFFTVYMIEVVMLF